MENSRKCDNCNVYVHRASYKNIWEVKAHRKGNDFTGMEISRTH